MKKYFDEKKRSIKFKLAGPGQKLSQDQSSSSQPSSSKVEDEAPKRVDTKESEDQRSKRLAAALQRSQGNPRINGSQSKTKKPNKEPQFDNNKSEREENVCPITDEQQSSQPGVFFRCPALDDKLVLSRPEWHEKIRAHIFDLKEADDVLGSILQIKSLNSEQQVDECISLLMKYLRNIIENPENDKFKSIRMGNPKFSEKVLSVEGALDFILAVGFEKHDANDTNSEPYIKFGKDSTSELEILMNSLLEISGFTLELDRDFQLFEPKDISNELSALPDDFFEITVADIKKQQQQRFSTSSKFKPDMSNLGTPAYNTRLRAGMGIEPIANTMPPSKSDTTILCPLGHSNQIETDNGYITDSSSQNNTEDSLSLSVGTHPTGVIDELTNMVNDPNHKVSEDVSEADGEPKIKKVVRANISTNDDTRVTQLEKESMLMTKKMRELEKAKYSRRKALFTRIRVRLPNDHVIQGTFSVKEVFQNLLQFIDEHIEIDSEYVLMSPPAYVYDKNVYGKTFDELNLHPAVHLILKTSCENIIFKTQKDC